MAITTSLLRFSLFAVFSKADTKADLRTDKVCSFSPLSEAAHSEFGKTKRLLYEKEQKNRCPPWQQASERDFKRSPSVGSAFCLRHQQGCSKHADGDGEPAQECTPILQGM